jgi:hypothetical protein
MKRYHIPVLLALVLILPALALTGCPQDAGGDSPSDTLSDNPDNGNPGGNPGGDNPGSNPGGDNPGDNPDNGNPGGNPDNPDDNPDADVPSGSLGEGDLVLKGTVYQEQVDSENMKFEYAPYTAGGTVEVYVSGGSKLGEGDLTAGGDFEITVTEKPGVFQPLAQIFYDWVPTAEPGDAQIVEIYLRLKDANNSSLSKEEVKEASGTYPSDFSYAFEDVVYVYADRDATITLIENNEEGSENGVSYTTTAEAATLKLTRGWNALWYKRSAEGAAGSVSQIVSVSVGNPNFKWVLFFYDEDED